MRRIIWYALLAILPITTLAQTSKESVQTAKAITVSQEEPYTDHIALTNDAKDKDLMVKELKSRYEPVSLKGWRNMLKV